LIFNALEVAYAEPARAYHTAAHIRDCLAQFDPSRHTARRPNEVEAAIWFHDAVYVPGAADNEDRSALLAQTTLADAGAPPEVGHCIAGLVRATQHLVIPSQPDAALLCDIDLSILGRTPEVFDEFERRIREEYAWVPEPVYRGARAEILAGFLRRGSIFQTDHFRDRYEIPARANLKRVIKALGG
jgi:predicted metal-dependent HD superfamily phosphohydrolase